MDERLGEQNSREKSNSRWLWIIPVVLALVAVYVVLVFTTVKTSAATPYPNQSDIVAPALAGPDLTITKSHQGDFIIDPNAVYTYTVVVSNIGDAPVSGTITVTDVLPDVLIPQGVTGAGWGDPCGFSGQSLTCVYSNTAGVPPTTTLPTLSLLVKVSTTAATTSIVNSATVANPTDVNTSNNTADNPTTLVGADLAVNKTVTPSSPSTGSVITYTITLNNNGPSQATGIVLTDTLPAGITLRTPTPASYNPSNGRWSVGTLANGASATLRLSATVDPDSLGKIIVNSIDGLYSDTPDLNLNNNTASATFSVQATQVRGIVSDRKTGTPLTSAKVEILDSASRLYSVNTTTTGWYTFTNTITTPLATGSATIRASRAGYASKSASAVIVQGQSLRQDFALDTADLLFTKTDGLSTVNPGKTITYTMTISNVGTIAATNVVITDVLPTFMTYITDTLGISHTIPAAHTYVWRLNNNIDPGKALRFKLSARVADALPSPATALTNQARVTTQTPEVNTSNNIASDTTTSTGSPNPTITLSVTPSQVKTGQNATYTIKVTNTGTAPMTSVSIGDTFSSFLDISSAKTTKGTASVNNTSRRVTVTLDVLSPNSEVTVTVVARVNTSATVNTTVSNVATLTYVFGGSNFSRNSNTVSFQILVTSTLPGTGGLELRAQAAQSRSYLLAYISSALLLILAVFAFIYFYRNRVQQPEWGAWALRMGVMLTVAGLLFGVAGVVLAGVADRQVRSQAALQSNPDWSVDKAAPRATHAPETLIWPGVTPQIPGSELDKLPDFPIPTPTIHPDVAQDESKDISPVNRIIIPALALDTVVKYVPYDGLTWMIAGLQQEIAWMGDTSWPGLGGNTALAGHVTLRTGRDGPFRNLSDLRYGDAIFVYTEKNIYEYMVQDLTTVEATDLSVLETTSDPRLTLITCTEWDPYTGFYTKRLIVSSDLIGSKPINEISLGN
jgi:LPXTG-site transpeptidase (sortase) family protein